MLLGVVLVLVRPLVRLRAVAVGLEVGVALARGVQCVQSVDALLVRTDGVGFRFSIAIYEATVLVVDWTAILDGVGVGVGAGVGVVQVVVLVNVGVSGGVFSWTASASESLAVASGSSSSASL